MHLLCSHVFFFFSSPTLTSWPPSSSPRHLLPLFLPLFLSSTGWAGPIPEYSVRPSLHSRISTVPPQPLAEDHRTRTLVLLVLLQDHLPDQENTPETSKLPSQPKRPEPAASPWTRTNKQKQAQPVPVQSPSRSLRWPSPTRTDPWRPVRASKGCWESLMGLLSTGES